MKSKLRRHEGTKYTLIIESNMPRPILEALGLSYDNDLDDLIDDSISKEMDRALEETIEPDPIKVDTPAISLDEIRALAKKVQDYTGSTTVLPNLLSDFGCRKISDLKPDQQALFVNRLNELLNA